MSTLAERRASWAEPVRDWSDAIDMLVARGWTPDPWCGSISKDGYKIGLGALEYQKRDSEAA